MQALIAAGRIADAPFGKSPGDALRQGVDVYTKPFSCDRSQTAVKIGDHAVEIDAENKCSLTHHRRIQDAGCRGQGSNLMLSPPPASRILNPHSRFTKKL